MRGLLRSETGLDQSLYIIPVAKGSMQLVFAEGYMIHSHIIALHNLDNYQLSIV